MELAPVSRLEDLAAYKSQLNLVAYEKRFFLHMSQPHFPITDHAYRFPGACPKHIKQMMGLENSPTG